MLLLGLSRWRVTEEMHGVLQFVRNHVHKGLHMYTQKDHTHRRIIPTSVETDKEWFLLDGYIHHSSMYTWKLWGKTVEYIRPT